MNLKRIGFASLIIGLILLLTSASSNTSGLKTYSFDSLDENQTQTYKILIAPVGPANVSIGFSPEPAPYLPEGFSQIETNLPVHFILTDTKNKTLAEQNVITPHFLDIDFKTRGVYTVYVTNKGTEEVCIPIGVQFEYNNPQNKEADKFLLSLISTVLGAVVVCTDFVVNFVSRRRN